MKQLAEELISKAEASSREVSELKKMLNGASIALQGFKKDHALIAGSAEAAIGIAAIALGASLFDPIDYGTKIPELIGSVTGAGIVGQMASSIGGIGIVAMGSAFAIPAAAVSAIGASVGAVTGWTAGWFGTELALRTATVVETLSQNVSGAVLVAFGCYMLFLGLKDMWRAGGEFITYLKNLGVSEIAAEELS